MPFCLWSLVCMSFIAADVQAEVSNWVFHAPSTIMVISGQNVQARLRETPWST